MCDTSLGRSRGAGVGDGVPEFVDIEKCFALEGHLPPDVGAAEYLLEVHPRRLNAKPRVENGLHSMLSDRQVQC